MQLFRYLVQVAICLLLNFLFIKIFVEQFHIYPTPAKILTTVLVVTFSYLSQRYFTFRKSTS
ncbi:MAG TPA: GtrA family protein [Flavihumibacter sp.]|nr:GtrA family protein [Flavihumibacter sp.]